MDAQASVMCHVQMHYAATNNVKWCKPSRHHISTAEYTVLSDSFFITKLFYDLQ
jgi:hypothetical protein